MKAGQEKAIRAIELAASKLREVIMTHEWWVEDSVEFKADFHFEATRYDKATAFGRPVRSSLQFYRNVFLR